MFYSRPELIFFYHDPILYSNQHVNSYIPGGAKLFYFNCKTQRLYWFLDMKYSRWCNNRNIYEYFQSQPIPEQLFV